MNQGVSLRSNLIPHIPIRLKAQKTRTRIQPVPPKKFWMNGDINTIVNPTDARLKSKAPIQRVLSGARSGDSARERIRSREPDQVEAKSRIESKPIRPSPAISPI